MKSASWLMYEDDYILRQCGTCGFSTRSPSTYRRHSRSCVHTSPLLKPAENPASSKPGSSSSSSTVSSQCSQSDASTIEDSSAVCAVVENSAALKTTALESCENSTESTDVEHPGTPNIADNFATSENPEEASLSSRDTSDDELAQSSILSHKVSDSSDKVSSTTTAQSASQKSAKISDRQNAAAAKPTSKHRAGQVFSCQHCDFTAVGRSELRDHFRLAHVGVLAMHRCEHCDYTSTDHRNLERHLIRHLLSGAAHCTLCSFSSSASCVRRHMSMHHISMTVATPTQTVSSQINDSGKTEDAQQENKSVKLKILMPISGQKSTKRSSTSECCTVPSKLNRTTSKESTSSLESAIASESNELVDAKQKLAKKKDSTPVAEQSPVGSIATDSVDTGNKNMNISTDVESSESQESGINPNHAMDAENADDDDETDVTEVEIQVEIIGGEKPETRWTCLACGAHYDQRSKIRRHVKTKHDVPMFECNLIDLRPDIDVDLSLETNLTTSNVACARTIVADNSSTPVSNPEENKTDSDMCNKNEIVGENVSEPTKSLTLEKDENVSQKPAAKTVQHNISTSLPVLSDVPERPIQPNFPLLPAPVKLLPNAKLLTAAASKTIKDIVPVKKAIVLPMPQKLWKNISICPRPILPPKLRSETEKSNAPKEDASKQEDIPSLNQPVHSDDVESEIPQKSTPEQKSIEKQESKDNNETIDAKTLLLLKPPDSASSTSSSSSSVSSSSEIELKLGEPSTDADRLNPPDVDLTDKGHKLTIVMVAAAKKDDIPTCSSSSSSPSNMLKCAHCSFSTLRILELRRHLMVAHSEEKKYACSECDCCYRHESSLSLHKRHKHQKDTPPDAADAGNPGGNNEVDDGKKLSADEDAEKVDEGEIKSIKKSPIELAKKTESNADESGRGGIFPTSAANRRKGHIWKRRTSTLVNPDSSVPTDENSDKNGADFIEDVGYKCRYCGYVSKQASMLGKHMKIHTGQRDYWCRQPNCTYRTIWGCDMKRHINKFHAEIVEGNNIHALVRLTYRPGGKTPPSSPQKHQTTQKTLKDSVDVPHEIPVAMSRKRHYIKHKMSSKEVEQTKCMKSDSDEPCSLDDKFHESSEKSETATDAIVSDPEQERTERAHPFKITLRSPETSKNDRERYRPFKCSECGRRSNWKFDLAKHIQKSHPTANVIRLSPDVARSSFNEILQRISTKNVIRCSKGIWRWSKRTKKEADVACTVSSGFAESKKIKEESEENDEKLDKSCDADVRKRDGKPMSELEKVLTSTDVHGNSIGMIDLLRLRRFQCLACPYRSNHRGDLGRHIRMRHGRGACPIGILSTEEAAATLQAYRIQWNRKRAWLTSGKSGSSNPSTLSDKSNDSLKDGIRKSSGNPNQIDVTSESVKVKEEVDLSSKETHSGNSTGHHAAAKEHKSTEPHDEDANLRKKFREFVGDDRMDATKCCDICPFRTDRTGLLALHKLQHRAPSPGTMAHGGTTFSCPHCPFFVRTTRQLECHIALHDTAASIAAVQATNSLNVSNVVVLKTKYVCENCPFVSYLRNEFWLHRRLHRRPTVKPVDRKYACTFCPFWVSDRRSMSEHRHLHTAGYYPQLPMATPVVPTNSLENKKSLSASSSQSTISDPEEMKMCPQLEPVRLNDIVLCDHDVAECCPMLVPETCSSVDLSGRILETESCQDDVVIVQNPQPLLIPENESSELPPSTEKSISSAAPPPSFSNIPEELETVPPSPDAESAKLEKEQLEKPKVEIDSDIASLAEGRCQCAMQCPYCYYSIASVRLLRQHMIFHVGVSDAVKFPVFEERFDEFEDGAILDATVSSCYGVLRTCDQCRHKLLSDSPDPASMTDVDSVDEKLTFFALMSLLPSVS